MKRCNWAEKPVFHKYHDKEWGCPIKGKGAKNDKKLFEFLTLEGAQAGLSWETILKKREGYKKNFADWDVLKISKLTDKKLDRILKDTGIVRNRLKVYSVRTNARAFISIQKEFGSFSKYLWSWTDEKVVNNKIKSIKDVPNNSPLSDKISEDLKSRGFKFVGSTIIYAYLQAVGVVNDHEDSCDFKNN